MGKRIYLQSAIALVLLSTGIFYYGPDIFLYFKLAEEKGAIIITGNSGDSSCTATSWDNPLETWCYAYINFSVFEDNFWYPVNYDPYGRNNSFDFTPQVKEYIFQRSWGKGWRTIPLDKTCKGTWCGGKFGLKFNKFSVAWREGRDYQVRIVAIKHNKEDIIKWGFGSVDPTWYEFNIEEIKECVTTSSNQVKHKYGICTKIILVGTLDENNTNQTSEKEIEDNCYLGNYIDIINTTICKTLAFEIEGKLIDFTKAGWNCKKEEYKIICDAPYQSNLDGECQSGERCVIFDIRDLSRKDIGVSNTPKIKELKVR